MTNKKRPPLRMNVQQAAVHSAFEIAHQRVVAAEAAMAATRAGSTVEPQLLRELMESLLARATQWDRLWSVYERSVHVHAHLRAAPMFAAQRDRQIAAECEKDLKKWEGEQE